MKNTLPSTSLRPIPDLLLEAIPTIQWPLDSLPPPMHFQSLEEMKAIRGASSSSSMILPDLTNNLVETIEELFHSDGQKSSESRRHFGLVSLALILLGHGMADECHCLVTPLSWPEDLHFGYGPSIYSQISLQARSYATYVHSLVHRKEAFNVGEFGMLGFANANYWSNAVARTNHHGLPHAALQEEVQTLTKRALNGKTISKSTRDTIQAWCQKHDLSPSSSTPSDFFENRAIHELSAMALRLENQNPDLRTFAENVCEMEVRILLSHALENAGFQVNHQEIWYPNDTAQSPFESKNSNSDLYVDESIALAAAKKVSSAHLAKFQSGDETLVVRQTKGDSTSVAAGIACRLLQVPACRLATPLDDTFLSIWFPSSSSSCVFVGTELSSGDMIAMKRTKEKQLPEISLDTLTCLNFVACEPNDAKAVFVDRLHGSRGETPTTVIQWSKGTMF